MGRNFGSNQGRQQSSSRGYGNRIPPTQGSAPVGSPGITAPPVASELDRKIVVEGDARELVRSAREFALTLQERKVTQTSVRRLFGEVRRIEMLWQQDREAARRRAWLLIPRMAYAASRDSALDAVRHRLEPMVDLAVQDDATAEIRFRRCAEYFEAVVAYLKPKDPSNAR